MQETLISNGSSLMMKAENMELQMDAERNVSNNSNSNNTNTNNNNNNSNVANVSPNSNGLQNRVEAQETPRDSSNNCNENSSAIDVLVRRDESIAISRTGKGREPLNCCAGCREPIKDRFIFSVIDLHWHQDCVQCADCSLKLTERCYEIDRKLYCKLDYWRRFGPKCFACRESIERSELVQRIKGNRVYHLKCFTCNDCNKQLKAGEQLHLIDGKRLLCKQDYNQLATSNGRNSINGQKSAKMRSSTESHHQQTYFTLTSCSSNNDKKLDTDPSLLNRIKFSDCQRRAGTDSMTAHSERLAEMSCGENDAELEDLDQIDEYEELDQEDNDDDKNELDEDDEDEDDEDLVGQNDLTLEMRLNNRLEHNSDHFNNGENIDNNNLENEENHSIDGSNFIGATRLQQLMRKSMKEESLNLNLNSNSSANLKRKRRRKQKHLSSSSQQQDSSSMRSKKLASRNGKSILNGLANSATASMLAQGQVNLDSGQQSVTSPMSQAHKTDPNCSSSSSSVGSIGSNSSTGSSPSQRTSHQHHQHQLNLERGHRHLSSQQDQQSASHLGGGQNSGANPNSGSTGGGGHKPTRVRTVLNEKQLQTLRDCYATNPRPDALVKEQLVDLTGLSPRVIRVWFQNKRCKDKKKSILYKQMQQHEKDGRHLAGMSLMRGIPMVATSPVQYDELSTVSSTPGNQQQSGIMLELQGGGASSGTGDMNSATGIQLDSPQQTRAQNHGYSSAHSPANSVDIHAYQPPWDNLIEYAHQQRSLPPQQHQHQHQPTADRINTDSPRYQQLMGQIHGYANHEQPADQSQFVAQTNLASNGQHPMRHQQQQQQQHQHQQQPVQQQQLSHLQPPPHPPPPPPPQQLVGRTALAVSAPLVPQHLHQFQR